MTKKVVGGVKKVDSSAILHRKRCKLEYVPDVLQTILRDMCRTNSDRMQNAKLFLRDFLALFKEKLYLCRQ